MIARIEELMRHDTAGDPLSGIKWTRRTTRNIAEQLATMGIPVSKNTVGRLLKGLGFRLRVNRKQIAIRTTSTTTGLAVTAHLITGSYAKGVRVTDSEMRMLSLQRHDTLGRWNYTLQPRQIVN